MTDEEKAEEYMKANCVERTEYIGYDSDYVNDKIEKAYLDGFKDGKIETMLINRGFIHSIQRERERLMCCGNCKHWNCENIQKYCEISMLKSENMDNCINWELIDE